ncbi:hypothetical protein J008_06487 [Cryptococcus neoformans]|nr:hypothetical protein J008_06487 [Cryptococcus neoformans var. grubii]
MSNSQSSTPSTVGETINSTAFSSYQSLSSQYFPDEYESKVPPAETITTSSPSQSGSYISTISGYITSAFSSSKPENK